MEELNNEIFKIFEKKLKERLNNLCTNWDDFRKDKGDFLSEDNIRYIFFSVLNSYYEKSKIILEFPFGYPNKEKNDIESLDYELDALLRTSEGNYAFEIKYHRNLGNSNLNRTVLAGSVINDLIRLKYFENQYLTKNNTKKYFIYLTDKEMYSYFINKRNGLDKFFVDKSFEFNKNLKQNVKSFQKAISFKLKDDDSCSVEKVYEADLPKEHCLIIWKIN